MPSQQNRYTTSGTSRSSFVGWQPATSAAGGLRSGAAPLVRWHGQARALSVPWCVVSSGRQGWSVPGGLLWRDLQHTQSCVSQSK
jgi:hypothetical protein